MLDKNENNQVKKEQQVLLRWMKPIDIERELGFKTENQAHMRSKKRIPFVKVGGYVLYDRIKIDAWLKKHEVEVAS